MNNEPQNDELESKTPVIATHAPETCACGNHPVAPNKRVCAECADARKLYPALFHDLPDETD